MNYPHHVTQFNQGQPCSLHAQTEQPDTVESHFGFVLTIINNQYVQPQATDLFQTIHEIAGDAGTTAQHMSNSDLRGTS